MSRWLQFTSLAVFSLLLLPASHEANAAEQEGREGIIILDKTGEQNLRIETEEAEERDFQTTLFAIGRLEEIPSSRSVLSSRIPGRVVEISVFPGDVVTNQQILARVESRQPGNPPPTIALHAPQGGIVVASHVRLGQPVVPESELLDISDRSRLWAVAKIPEPELARIAPGTVARIRVPALGARIIDATLLRYGVEADRKAGAIEGIFEVSNADGALQPGMRAEFSLVLETRSDVLSIPRSAVQGDPTKRVVFVKDFELPHAFIPVPVALGAENDDYVEVIAGLFPADEVVTQGSYSLGFAGSGSGMSLKEALDAAHGHEHNEDGSELSPEQQAAAKREAAEAAGGGTGGPLIDIGNLPLLIYAGIITLIALVLLQLLWNSRRKRQLLSAAVPKGS